MFSDRLIHGYEEERQENPALRLSVSKWSLRNRVAKCTPGNLSNRSYVHIPEHQEEKYRRVGRLTLLPI
jgi:hypothetical protein